MERITTVAAVVPWDEVKLIDVGLEQYNDADYVIVAKSTLGKALVILEIDNRGHAGGGIYSPAAEKQKNDGNFNAGNGFDKVLFLRVNPSGQYTTSDGEQASLKTKVTLLPLNIGYNILGSLGDIDFTVSSWATLAIRPSLPKNNIR